MTAPRIAAVLLVLAVRAAGAADFSTGVELYDKGNYEGAAEEWQALANQGDMRARYRLAQMYAEGLGVRKDEGAALHWFRQASEQGSVAARYELALMYSLGRGVIRDPARAAHWYGLLAADGHITAQYLLARMLESGSGVARDMSRALWWFRRAAEQGHVGAQTRLGEAFASGDGVEVDLVAAWAWFDLAAAKGDEVATTRRANLRPLLGEERLAEAETLGRVLRAALVVRPAVSEPESAPAPTPAPTPESAVEPETESAPESSLESAPAPELFSEPATEMIRVRAGCFGMGSPPGEEGRHDNETLHPVCVEEYSMSRYEVTRGHYASFVRATSRSTPDTCNVYSNGGWSVRSGHSWRNPGYAQDDDHPVTCVSRDDALAFARWLSDRQGRDYRLPTEAEWEHAARAGSPASRHWGESAEGACTWGNVGDRFLDRDIREWAWQVHPCDDGYVYTAPVGSYRVTLYGLHDMLGNVWEWTCSAYDSAYGSAERHCSSGGGNGVVRGGSWSNSPRWVRAAARFETRTDARFDLVGFRLAHD